MENMRGKITVLIVVLLVALGLNLVPASAQAEEFEVYAENEYLILRVNPTNAEFVVEDKRTGALWHSNPPNRGREEKVARGAAAQEVGSQFSIAYFTNRDNIRYLNNRADSVAHGQFELFPLEDGVRVEFILGMQWDDKSYLPVLISRERFEDLILAKLPSASDRRLFTDSYDLVTMKRAPEGYEQQEIYRIDKAAVFGENTLYHPEKELKAADRKKLIELVADQIVANRADLADRRGLTAENFLPLQGTETYVLKDRIRAWDLEDMIDLLKQIGYTPEDAAVDHGFYAIDQPQENPRIFHVAVEYVLDGDNLLVRLPLDDVEYPKNVLDENNIRVTLPLYSISLLKYFGAGSPTDEGYILVPDSAGALINFNNGKFNSPAYSQYIYGNDSALSPRRDLTSFQGQAHLPVFGLKHEDKALFALVEENEAHVRIRADVAGRTSSYNIGYPEIIVLPMAKTKLQGSIEYVVEGQVEVNEINVYQRRKNTGDLVVRYSFLYDDQANYVGMAKELQKELVERKGLQRLPTASGDIPFFVELLGAAHATEPVLGVPRTVVKRMTSFEQARQIVQDLLDNEITNLKVRYSGWLKGGIKHQYPRKASVERQVGTERELKELNAFLSDAGVELFLDVDFVNVNKKGVFDGFIPIMHASRYLNRQIARKFEYNLATYKLDAEKFSYILSPSKLEGLVDGFLHDFDRFDVDGLALRNMGTQVNSDFRESDTKLVDRQASVVILKEQLGSIADRGYKILVEGGNAYTLPYADYAVNVPLQSSILDITDAAVPFLPLVLHGYLEYAGEPINLAQDFIGNMLRTIEAGASPYFLWSFADSSVLKDSDFTYLFSTGYEYWLADAVSFYQRAKEVLNDVRGQLIVDHGQLAPQVFGTRYESGDLVVVNYGDDAAWVDGVKIPALDFTLIRGGN